MINKFIVFALVISICFACSSKPDAITPVQVDTSPTAEPSVMPKPPPSPTVVPQVPVPIPEPKVVPKVPDTNHSDIGAAPGWKKVSTPLWEVHMPTHIIRPNNTIFDFMSIVKTSDSSEMVFGFDGVRGQHKELNELLANMLVILDDRNVTVITNNRLEINGNAFLKLKTVSGASDNLGSIVSVDIYLSHKGNVSYVFSCGSKNFTENDSIVCQDIMNTIVLKD